MANPLKPILSATGIRSELEQKVISDLLGPAGGPDEEVVERTVPDRYLVGALAPRRRKGEPPPEVVTPRIATSAPDDQDEFPPVLNDELAEEGSDWPEDGPADLAVALPKTTEPSSFGLTICVGESGRRATA